MDMVHFLATNIQHAKTADWKIYIYIIGFITDHNHLWTNVVWRSCFHRIYIMIHLTSSNFQETGPRKFNVQLHRVDSEFSQYLKLNPYSPHHAEGPLAQKPNSFLKSHCFSPVRLSSDAINRYFKALAYIFATTDRNFYLESFLNQVGRFFLVQWYYASHPLV